MSSHRLIDRGCWLVFEARPPITCDWSLLSHSAAKNRGGKHRSCRAIRDVVAYASWSQIPCRGDELGLEGVHGTTTIITSEEGGEG